MLNEMYFLQEKESLITELRKELRLSNEEHRELLGKVNADDVIRRIRFSFVAKTSFIVSESEPFWLIFIKLLVSSYILLKFYIWINAIREWRQAGGLQPGMLGSGQAVVHDPVVPSPSVSASRKKQKINQSSVPSQSFGGPSPPFHPQAAAVSNQPSSSAARRGPVVGPKGKKHKSVR